MDLRKIKKLIELLEESDLAEMEIQEGEESIRLSRASAVAPQVAAPAGYAMAPPAAVPAAPAPVAAAESASPGQGAIAGETIKSPMVGTFYATPDPDSPPYVTVGATVKAGDTVCIIEAMKTYNPVEADRSGTITQILKKTGEPVEFGEPIFVIE